MLMVCAEEAMVECELVEERLACPSCAGVLAPNTLDLEGGKGQDATRSYVQVIGEVLVNRAVGAGRGRCYLASRSYVLCLLEKKGMMVSELVRQIAEMVLAGGGVDAIEEAIIDPAPLDEEQKSVLWLYAQTLQERRSDGMLAARELALNES